MQELEVKFYVPDLLAFTRVLEDAPARLDAPREHEVNLRFDTPAGDLSRAYQALRLRQDRAARLTYKGPSLDSSGARLREEIEFQVDNFAAAQRFLEALGYQIWVIYEKYRTTYNLAITEGEAAEDHVPDSGQEVLVVLDELPYGNFVEIEGLSAQDLRMATDRLRLDWDARVGASYLELFQSLRARSELPFRDLTFENFQGLSITPEELGVRAAWPKESPPDL